MAQSIDPARVRKGSLPKHMPMATRNINISTDGLKPDTFDSGLFSPPSSRVDIVMDASRMLISPPPEEILRSASKHTPHNKPTPRRPDSPPFVPVDAVSTTKTVPKRKRQPNPGSISSRRVMELVNDTAADHSQTVDTTPNPKPRKQSKHHNRSLSVDSPTRETSSQQHSLRRATIANRKSVSSKRETQHEVPYVTDRDADLFLVNPHLRSKSISSRRRSSTPMPVYEPPAEQFTPPREVFIAPIASRFPKSSRSIKRQPTVKTVLKTNIKTSPPELNLTSPLPPPSPTDDPLLLSGPRVFLTTSKISRAKQRLPAIKIDPIPPFSGRKSQPRNRAIACAPMSPDSFGSGAGRVSASSTADDDLMPMPSFESDTPYISNGAWDDSDSDPGLDPSEGFRDTFTVFTVPTKFDSPDSQPKENQAGKGRSISPFLDRGPSESRMEGLNSDNEEMDQVHDVGIIDPEYGGREPSPHNPLPLSSQQRVKTKVIPMPTTNDSNPDDGDVDEASIVDFGVTPRDAGPEASLHEHGPHAASPPDADFDMGDSMCEQEGEEEGGEEGEEGESIDSDIVSITSHDPRAAARAAAILKQHDYDCFTQIEPKDRRHSHSTVESIFRSSRRSSIAQRCGITEAPAAQEHAERRATLGRIHDDQVSVPTSPSLTLTELLQEAEVGLDREGSVAPVNTPVRSTTPVPEWSCRSPTLPDEPEAPPILAREWTRDDWKVLDACFAEERLEVGQHLDLEPYALADVDDVQNDKIVDRFVEQMGGPDIVDALGPGWSHEKLLTRVLALERKQRAGTIPRSPAKHSAPFSSFMSPMVVPEFSPLLRSFPLDTRAFPSTIRAEHSKDNAPEGLCLPSSLLAPRYSRLLEEAIAVDSKHAAPPVPPSVEPSTPSDSTACEQDEVDHFARPESSPKSFGTQLKGILLSYLPKVSKAAHGVQKPKSSRPGLPLPPREVLDKPRGPISTPARPLPPKPAHPKELVHLQPAPPPKPSMIPRVGKPQRLVELHPLPPAPPPPPPTLRSRKSSTGSVKDLIKCFEERQSMEAQNVKKTLVKTMRSVGDLNKEYQGSSKPAWRP